MGLPVIAEISISVFDRESVILVKKCLQLFVSIFSMNILLAQLDSHNLWSWDKVGILTSENASTS